MNPKAAVRQVGRPCGRILSSSTSSDPILSKTELLTPKGEMGEEEEDSGLGPGGRDNGTSDITNTTSRQRNLSTSSSGNTSTGRRGLCPCHSHPPTRLSLFERKEPWHLLLFAGACHSQNLAMGIFNGLV